MENNAVLDLDWTVAGNQSKTDTDLKYFFFDFAQKNFSLIIDEIYFCSENRAGLF